MATETLRVLVDVNIVFDVLSHREPHFQASAAVWREVERKTVRGILAAHGMTTVHYLLTRHTGRAKAGSAIADLLRVFEVAPVDGPVLSEAMSLGMTDFEDAVHVAAGVAAGAEYIVTRDPKGFRHGPLPVLMPGELLALLAGDGDGE